jgi:hypothetical protein
VDGHFTFTSVIKIAFSEKNIASIYQSGNSLQVTLSSSEKEVYNLQLINSAGQVIKKDDFLQSAPGERHVVDLPAGILQGIYYVRLSSMHNSFNQSLLLQ